MATVTETAMEFVEEPMEVLPTGSVPLPSSEKLSVTVTKLIPYTFDLGNLLCNDANPLSSKPSEAELASTARDCAQALINQLLTTCPVTCDPAEGVLLTLPPCTTPLPREKHLPPLKQETTWEKFAKKKGIKDKKRGEGKMVYDEASGEWVPKWGYKGRNKDGEGDWIVEVDEKKEREARSKDDGATVRSLQKRERMDRVRRNDRKQRANDRKERKGGS